MAAQMTGMANLLANMQLPPGFDPVVVNLPSPPRLEGSLAPNTWLSKAVKFADNVVYGPESMVVVNGYVYTGLADGWVVEVNPNGQLRKILRMSINTCGRPGAPEHACGRPLGIRADKQGYLVVADAYNGIFRINPQTGRYKQLVNARTQRVNNKPLGYINDLAVASDGTIFFTSSSSKYSPSRYLDIILEAETSGRVLVYNPRARGPAQVQELVTNLNYPNGLELSKDESFLLIAEGARARIFKAHIGQNSPKRGQIETFAENLPGFVDNIRRNPRDTYWVGLSRARHSELPSVLDTYGNQPKMRGAIMGMPREQVLQQLPKHAIAVELDAGGKIIRSLHDPAGTLYTSVSELQEEKGVLYIGSFNRPYIGKLNLADLPPVNQMPGDGGTPTGEATNGTVNQQLADFLEQIKQRLLGMNQQQVRDVVLVLVQKLVEAKLEALKAQQRAASLQQDLQKLQEMTGTTRPGGVTGTTPSMPSDTTAAGTGTGTTASSAAATTAAATTAATPSGTTAASGTAGTTAAPSGDDTTPSSSATTAGSTASGAGSTTPAATTASGASDATTAAAAATTAEATTAAGTTQT